MISQHLLSVAPETTRHALVRVGFPTHPCDFESLVIISILDLKQNKTPQHHRFN